MPNVQLALVVRVLVSGVLFGDLDRVDQLGGHVLQTHGRRIDLQGPNNDIARAHTTSDPQREQAGDPTQAAGQAGKWASDDSNRPASGEVGVLASVGDAPFMDESWMDG